MRLKIFIASTLLAITAVTSFVMPKPEYTSPDIISRLNIPLSPPGWRSRDFSDGINLQEDDRYNFISEVFARVYRHINGSSLLFLLLDAGNFHHPKVCFTASGFTVEYLPDFDLGPIAAKALHAKRAEEEFLVIYWITINGRHVDWGEQKLQQLYFSLFGKEKIGVMARMDIPVIDGDLDLAHKTARDFIYDIIHQLPPEDMEVVFGK